METWFNETEAIEKIRSATDGKSFYWKYIRINNEYRFADATTGYSPEHKSALKENEKPESAAFVKIRTDNGIEVRVEGYSMTLGIGPTKDEENRLMRIFS